MELTIQDAGALGVIASLIGLGFALWQRNFVMAQDAGNETMQRISGAISARRPSLPLP